MESSSVRIILLSLALLFVLPTQGSAQTMFPIDHEWSNEKGWQVYKNRQLKGCFGERKLSNGTVFLLGVIGDENRLIVGMSNDRLDFVKKGKTYKVKWLFDGKRSWNTSLNADILGTKPLLYGAYVKAAKLRSVIARSSQLRISRGNRLLASLSLKGTSATLKQLTACHSATPELLATKSAPVKKTQVTELVIASDLNKDALSLLKAGKYAAAEPLYRRALAIREKALGAEHPDVVQSLNNLAELLRNKGDYAAAEPLYRRALAIYEKALGAEHPYVGTSLNNLAVVLKTKGDYAAAEPLYRRALAITEKALGPEHPDVGTSLNNLAILLKDKGDFAAAEPLYRRALAITEKALGAEHPSVGTSLNNLANLLSDQGDYAAAEPLYRRDLAIQEKALGAEHPDVGTSLNGLALLLHNKGDYAGAEPLHRRALAIKEKALGAEHPDVGTSLNNLALLLNDKGDYAGALKFARKAASIGHPFRGIILSAIYAAENTKRELVAESFVAVQQVSKSSSGKALQSLAVRFAAGDSELARLVRQEQDGAVEFEKLNKSILTELSKTPGERNDDREKIIRSRIADLSTELKTIRSKLQREFPEFAELSKPSQIKLVDAQALLKNDEALVVIDVANKGEGKDYVWVATSWDIQWRRLNTKQGEIAKTLTNIREGLDLNTSLREPIDPATAHELYRKLLGPVEEIIKGKKHLLFVLNGAVSSLPPQILVTKPPVDKDFRNVAWLARDYAITILPTVSSLKLLRTQISARKAVKPLRGYGDPVFDPSANDSNTRVASRGYRAFFQAGQTNIEFLRQALPQLPGTARELIAVGKSLGVSQSEIVLGKAATETAVKRDKLDDYRVVYFATHGLVAGEVEQFNKSGAEPALAFSIPEKATALDDGLLMASEVAQLKLNADWVVLSACNTAAGGKPGADALSGLARAFFYAGAKSLLVSHWFVDDDATAELMKRTFKFASDNPNLRGAEALQQAMLSVMNDPDNPDWADPGVWAPFILVGEPRVGR